MKRGRLKMMEGCCYHLTHRCQERRYLLRFEQDRKNYIKRLRETSKKYPIDILNYIVTSNHVHLLVRSENTELVSRAMQYLQGVSGKDYNRRKKREGAFWTGRFRPTVIQSGAHLGRCLFYIDMNMVRAKRVDHPEQWHFSGYHELAGIRTRYRIINQDQVMKCLGFSNLNAFRNWYNLTLSEKLACGPGDRNPIWTECVAVGDLEWIEKLSNQYALGKKQIITSYLDASDSGLRIKEDQASYGLKISSRNMSSFAKEISNRL